MPRILQTPEWIENYLKEKGAKFVRFEGKRLFFICKACGKETSLSAFSHIRTYERQVGEYHFQCMGCFRKVAIEKKLRTTEKTIAIRNQKKDRELKELFLQEGSEMISSYKGINEPVTLRCRQCGDIDTFSSLDRVLRLPNRFLCKKCQYAARGLLSGKTQQKYTREFVSKELNKRNIQLLTYSEEDYSFSVLCNECKETKILVKKPKKFFNRKKIVAVCKKCLANRTKQRQSIPREEAEKYFISKGSILYQYSGNLKRIYFQCTQCKGEGTYNTFAGLRSSNPNCLCGECNFKNRCGEGAYNYNPELTEEDRRKKRTHNPHYHTWRGTVQKLAKSRCAISGKYFRKGHCHHFYPYKKYPQYRYSVWNGIFLSPKEHYLFHSIYGHENTTYENFLEFYKERTGRDFFNFNIKLLPYLKSP